MEETVTISKKEYEEMQDRLLELSSLEAAGVDDWGGYSYAMELYREAKKEE